MLEAFLILFTMLVLASLTMSLSNLFLTGLVANIRSLRHQFIFVLLFLLMTVMICCFKKSISFKRCRLSPCPMALPSMQKGPRVISETLSMVLFLINMAQVVVTAIVVVVGVLPIPTVTDIGLLIRPIMAPPVILDLLCFPHRHRPCLSQTLSMVSPVNFVTNLVIKPRHVRNVETLHSSQPPLPLLPPPFLGSSIPELPIT